jgi:3-keto-5-aminohexanoate cleavage enzyme
MEVSHYIWNFADRREYLKKLREGMPPVIITCAITGGVHGRELNSGLPETPDDQAQSIYEAYQAGASVVHVHARDASTGYVKPSTSPNDYRVINRKIRAKCPNLIINNTTGVGTTGVDMRENIRSLEADPELASLDCGPLHFRTPLKRREPPLTGRDEDTTLEVILPFTFSSMEFFAKNMMEKNIKPEIEVFHNGDFWQVDNLIEKGLLKKPYYHQFVMGFQKAAPAMPKYLCEMLEMMPPDSIFSVIGVGLAQVPMITMSIIMGGHIRVGMEDTVWHSRGRLYKSNAEQVERAANLVRVLGREVATPAEAREMLGISQKPKTYD